MTVHLLLGVWLFVRFCNHSVGFCAANSLIAGFQKWWLWFSWRNYSHDSSTHTADKLFGGSLLMSHFQIAWNPGWVELKNLPSTSWASRYWWRRTLWVPGLLLNTKKVATKSKKATSGCADQFSTAVKYYFNTLFLVFKMGIISYHCSETVLSRSINKVIISNLHCTLLPPSRALKLWKVLQLSSRVNANAFPCSASWEYLCVVVKWS